MPQSRLKVIWFILVIALVLSLSACQVSSLNSSTQQENNVDLTSTSKNSVAFQELEDKKAINIALKQAVAGREEVLVFLINEIAIDNIQFSEDRSLALVWLTLIDLDSGEVIPGEPGLAIAERQHNESGETIWDITLQVDSTWAVKLSEVPDSLLSQEVKSWYMPNIQAIPKEHKIYTGYRLPWESGRAVRVSGSVGHVFTYKSCPSTCLYAFDFADGTMFPVVAAKGGRVKYAVWNWPNGNTEHANFLVLEDNSTFPTTFQVYFHLAQDSIPEKFRAKGAEVLQGEYIGLADDTGYSTSHHLHFHVHTNTNSYWGTSVDIVFEDVEINGGRPRTCTEAANFPEYGAQCQAGNWFTSENGDRERPTGAITQPLPNETFITPNVTVRGTGVDDTGIGYIQIMATSDGEWEPVGPLLDKSPFTTTINLCEAGIPNGTFFLSLQLMDTAGKLSDGTPGLVQLEKKFSCPNDPPICIPSENQIALYSDTYYHGSCALFEIGEFSKLKSIQAIGDNNADSIQIGANVLAVLYKDNNFGGLKETFLASNPDLSKNNIGVNESSSLVVELRPDVPNPPILTAPQTSDDKDKLEDIDPIKLTWINKGENLASRSELTRPGGWNIALDWQTSTKWDVGILAAGEYTWTVWTRNISGESQSTLNFIVHKQDLPPVTEMVPFKTSPTSTSIKLEWDVLEGEEDLAYFDIQIRKDGSPWTDWKTALDSKTREIRLIGDPGSNYAFRMRSADKAGNLEDYPQKAEIKLKMPLNCSEDDFELNELSDNRWDGAAQLELNKNQLHNICGQLDVDWIAFSAQSGSTYSFNLEPISEGVSISSILFGMDHELALFESNPTEIGQPTEFNWTAPNTGIFYLRLSGSNPNLFGTDTQYQVRIDRIAQLEPTTFLWSTLLLPLVLAVVKFYSRLKARIDPSEEAL